MLLHFELLFDFTLENQKTYHVDGFRMFGRVHDLPKPLMFSFGSTTLFQIIQKRVASGTYCSGYLKMLDIGNFENVRTGANRKIPKIRAMCFRKS